MPELDRKPLEEAPAAYVDSREFDRRDFLAKSAQLVVGTPLAASILVTPASVRARHGRDAARTLRIAVIGDFETLDPNNSSTQRATEMCANLYDTLMWWPLTKSGYRYPAPAPNFVSRARVNKEHTRFVFTIPAGRKFASGRPITVEDIIWSLQRMAQTGQGQFYYGVTNIPAKALNKAITKVDDRTFAIATTAQSNFLLQVLATPSFAIFDKLEFEKQAGTKDPWGFKWSKTGAAGSGPFVLEKATPGVGSTLRRNPLYRGPRAAHVEEISLPIVPSAADRIALLKKGDVDIAEGLSFRQLRDLQGDPNIRIVRSPSQWQHLMIMNVKEGPFRNKTLRKAVSHAIPYASIVKDVYYGYAQRQPGPIPVGGRDRDRTIVGYAYDVNEARRLAKASGLTPLSVDLHYDAGIPEYSPLALVLQAALAQIDVRVTLRPTPSTSFEQQVYAKKWPLIIYNALGWVDDPAYSPRAFFDSRSFANLGNYRNARVDQLIDKMGVEADSKQRTAQAVAMQRLIFDDAPAVWLVQQGLAYAVRREVQGFYPHPTAIANYSSLRIG